MGYMTSWLTFTIDALAVYRLALLLSDDSGPWKLFSRFRSLLRREEKHNKALRNSDAASGVECVRCNSVWLAAPVAVFAIYRDECPPWLMTAGDLFLLWMALSALVILLNRIPKQ